MMLESRSSLRFRLLPSTLGGDRPDLPVLVGKLDVSRTACFSTR